MVVLFGDLFVVLFMSTFSTFGVTERRPKHNLYNDVRATYRRLFLTSFSATLNVVLWRHLTASNIHL